MTRIRNILAIIMLSVLIVFGFAIIHSIIDERHAQTLASLDSYSKITKSPQFSAEELAQEIPDGLTWILTDKDGSAFDWQAFCEQHTNCREAFRAKGIPTPQLTEQGPSPETMEEFYDRMANELWEKEHPNEDDSASINCTTDAECYAKHGHDM